MQAAFTVVRSTRHKARPTVRGTLQKARSVVCKIQISEVRGPWSPAPHAGNLVKVSCEVVVTTVRGAPQKARSAVRGTPQKARSAVWGTLQKADAKSRLARSAVRRVLLDLGRHR